MSDKDIVEQLVLEKEQIRQRAVGLANLVGAMTLQHGKQTKHGIEYRLTKSQVAQMDGRLIRFNTLKGGGVVVTVEDAPE